jgi:hypothetical protein
LILQGRGVQSWLVPAIQAETKLGPNVSRLTIAGRQTLAARFSHPSAHGALRWGDSLDAPYLVEVVEPTLRGVLDQL